MPVAKYILRGHSKSTAMATRARHGSYLFQRGNVWWIKLRSPNGRIERSLHTPDRKQAELVALPMIAEHKAALLAARPRLVMRPRKIEPGEYTVEGQRVIAT